MITYDEIRREFEEAERRAVAEIIGNHDATVTMKGELIYYEVVIDGGFKGTSRRSPVEAAREAMKLVTKSCGVVASV